MFPNNVKETFINLMNLLVSDNHKLLVNRKLYLFAPKSKSFLTNQMKFFQQIHQLLSKIITFLSNWTTGEHKKCTLIF